MKYDYTSVKNIYIVCGKTDMRKGIDGLATLVQDVYELDPYEDAIFLFSGRIKDENEVRLLSQKELRWLLEGLSIQLPKAIPPSLKVSL